MFVQPKKVWLGNRARAVIYLSEPSDAELLIKGGVAEPVYDDPLAPIPAKSMDLRRSTLRWHRRHIDRKANIKSAQSAAVRHTEVPSAMIEREGRDRG
jgi:hypothetical protein